MRRWLLLGEMDEQQLMFTGQLDSPDATLERVVDFTSADDEPTDEELAEQLEGRDGEFLLVPLDAARVVRAKTMTSVDVNVQRVGAYS